jgi:hypothetical protein
MTPSAAPSAVLPATIVTPTSPARRTPFPATRPAATTIDIIENSTYILDAVTSRLAQHPALTVRARASNWISYITEHSAPADVVVFRAELRDHVPAALKARAIAAEGALPVVSLGTGDAAHRNRLRAERALVIERSAGLPVLIDEIVTHFDARTSPRPAQAAPVGPLLSDREMQIACLYSGRSAPSAVVRSSRPQAGRPPRGSTCAPLLSRPAGCCPASSTLPLTCFD